MKRKDISKLMPPAGTRRVHPLKGFEMMSITRENPRAVQIGSPCQGVEKPPLDPTKLLTRKKGKILRIKHGYNPNSSSMGSIVFVLPAILFLVTVIFGALSGILSTIFMRNIDNPEKRTGQLYLKLQNTFYKKKMKEHLK